MNNSPPNGILDIEQHILNRLLGECVPVQEVAHELQLPEGTIIKLSDRLWLEMSISAKQQFIRFWQTH